MRPVPKRRMLADLAVIAVLAALTAWAAVRWIKPIHAGEDWMSDFRVATASPAEPPYPDILIMTITEEAMRTFPYRSPVQREFIRGSLEFLAGAGVRAVGVDLLFDQPTEPLQDDALRETMLNFPAPLIVARADARLGLEEWQLEYQDQFLEGLSTGLINLLKDEDGVVRRIYAGERGTTTELSFTHALARALGHDTPDRDTTLSYRATTGEEPPFASADSQFVALGILPVEWFADKIVLIGADLKWSDQHATPLGAGRPEERTTAGVVIHAHALAQLLEDRRFPEISPWAGGLLLLFMAVLAALIALWDFYLILKILLGLGGLTGLFFVGGWVFLHGGPMLPLFAPTLAYAGSFLLSSVYVARKQKASERYIRRAFGQYLSPSVIERLVADPRRLELGGEKRELSFIFSDIAGFTTLSEALAAEELIPLLQEYLDGMVRMALKHEGTIDKFIGDAVVVFFGAPSDQEDHARRAVACALDMDRFSEEFRQAQVAKGIEMGMTRIGVHTGVATVGNLGGQSRFDYTAIGDTVNTAARLESVNKHLGTRVCISQEAAKHCNGLQLRPVGALVLKGKSKGIEVFSPPPGFEPDPIADEEYQRAFASLHAEEEQALDLFRQLRAKYPQDGLIAFHCDRLSNGDRGSRIVMKEK